MAENNQGQQNQAAQEQDIHQLLKVRREKLANLQEAGKDPFQITKYDVTHHSREIKDNFETLEGKTVSIAGRIMQKRVMGKASFCNVQDLQGNIQTYVARDNIGEESYADFKKYDVGDIVGVKGEVFKTKTGEISIHAAEVTLLSKSLQILPEKFHGLTNTDIRYRQRYTDLIMNQDVKDTFVKRSKIISAIRRYLDSQNFMEVETPMLVANAGGAAARPFETHYNALDEDVKLRISLELYLKRLIVGGMERVYEIGRVFRNEGLDTRHNPEFTLMELYQAYTDYYGMMDLTENMFRYVAQEVCGTTVIPYAEETIDLGKPFERLTMVDAVKKYAGVDFDQIPDTAAAKKLADEKGVHYEERHAKGDILNLFFEEFVEEHLIQPVFIMDHPAGLKQYLPVLGKVGNGPEEQPLDALLVQMRCAAAVFAFEFAVALPDHPAVLVRAVPDLAAVEFAAIAADDLCRERAEAVVVLAFGLPDRHFILHLLPFLRIDNGRMALVHDVLRHLALFLERKSTVNFFCRTAEPLYFSFVRMLSMVLVCHFSLPRGVGMPLDVRCVAIQFTVLP